MSTYVTIWWVWFCFAIVLGIVELVAPAFIFLGFALGALAMAALVGLGLSQPASAMMALFAGLSLVAWIVLKRVFKGPTSGDRTFDYDVND